MRLPLVLPGGSAHHYGMNWFRRIREWVTSWSAPPVKEPEGLRLVRYAAYIPEVVLEAWFHQHLSQEINEKDETGHTVLWWAAAEGDGACVRALLALGADPDLTEGHRATCARLSAVLLPSPIPTTSPTSNVPSPAFGDPSLKLSS